MLLKLIREWCAAHDMSIAMLEYNAGIANGTIGRWGLGKAKPTINNLDVIARYTGMDFHALCDAWRKEYGKSNGTVN